MSRFKAQPSKGFVQRACAVKAQTRSGLEQVHGLAGFVFRYRLIARRRFEDLRLRPPYDPNFILKAIDLRCFLCAQNRFDGEDVFAFQASGHIGHKSQ